ncbi:hypothetical protein B0H19DRAFT_1224581 [Mycena capillaripes]|nr:hypothetical protein B0H19DRAFT_1224581 [Mycena capillaripes]
MSFVRTLALPCVMEEDPRDDESDGGGEDRSMMGDIDDHGKDERQRGGWALLGDELVHARAFLDAGERRGSRKYHKGRVALRTTGLRMAYVRTGRGKNTAGMAEAWEELAGKEQASPTSGRSIRARETAVSEVIWRKEGRGPIGGSSDGSPASLYVVVGTRLGLDEHLPIEWLSLTQTIYRLVSICLSFMRALKLYKRKQLEPYLGQRSRLEVADLSRVKSSRVG